MRAVLALALLLAGCGGTAPAPKPTHVPALSPPRGIRSIADVALCLVECT